MAGPPHLGEIVADDPAVDPEPGEGIVNHEDDGSVLPRLAVLDLTDPGADWEVTPRDRAFPASFDDPPSVLHGAPASSSGSSLVLVEDAIVGYGGSGFVNYSIDAG